MRRSLRKLNRAAVFLAPRLASRLGLSDPASARRCRPQREEAEVLTLAEHERVRFGPGHLQTYRWRGPGPTVLLMHGWSAGATRLARFVPRLRESGFQVLAFDAPGNGGSSGWHSDLIQFERALAFALERFGPIEGLVAHAFGARAAARVLASEPHPKLRAVSLIGMPRDAVHDLDWFRLTLELREHSHSSMREEYLRVFGAPGEVVSGPRARPPLRLPALVVHDREAELAPIAHSQALVAQLPDAELYVAPCRRDGLLTNAGVIEAVGAFLDRHLPTHGNGAALSTDSRADAHRLRAYEA